LRAVGDPSGRVYAIGDCAHVEGQDIPCTAQAAERQGRYLAKAMGKLAKGTSIIMALIELFQPILTYSREYSTLCALDLYIYP